MSERPLSSSPLDNEERAQWLARINRVLEYAGAPGDWGYKTDLGELTAKLMDVRNKLMVRG